VLVAGKNKNNMMIKTIIMIIIVIVIMMMIITIIMMMIITIIIMTIIILMTIIIKKKFSRSKTGRSAGGRHTDYFFFCQCTVKGGREVRDLSAFELAKARGKILKSHCPRIFTTHALVYLLRKITVKSTFVTSARQ